MQTWKTVPNSFEWKGTTERMLWDTKRSRRGNCKERIELETEEVKEEAINLDSDRTKCDESTF